MNNIEQAVQYLKKGKVIAYPTESVYGFGCDPFNVDAVSQILRIKQRSIDKGFILIASEWDHIEPLVESLAPHLSAQILSSWPGPITWTIPASRALPHWIRGQFDEVAVRITAHPIARALCQGFGQPIISTSANIEGAPPTRDYRTTVLSFSDEVDFIVDGQVGGAKNPTEIRSALTGDIIRPG